ncbi:hypothetical protein BDQ17DRAFT_1330953 [Cyathus striatus]|nr:hypothetical protein BDQ17DRAFT_1330953 [Cyathus striatus]
MSEQILCQCNICSKQTVWDAESRQRIPGLKLKHGVWKQHQKNYTVWQKENLHREFQEQFSDAIMNATIDQGKHTVPDNPLFSSGGSDMDVEPANLSFIQSMGSGSDTNDADGPSTQIFDFLPIQEQAKTNMMATIHAYQEEFYFRKKTAKNPRMKFLRLSVKGIQCLGVIIFGSQMH